MLIQVLVIKDVLLCNFESNSAYALHGLWLYLFLRRLVCIYGKRQCFLN